MRGVQSYNRHVRRTVLNCRPAKLGSVARILITRHARVAIHFASTSSPLPASGPEAWPMLSLIIAVTKAAEPEIPKHYSSPFLRDMSVTGNLR